MEQVTGELEQYGTVYRISIPSDVLSRARAARDLFNEYDINRDELTEDVCYEILEEGIDGVFAVHWGGSVYGENPQSTFTQWERVAVEDSQYDADSAALSELDEKDLTVHAVEYQFALEDEYVEEEGETEYMSVMPEDDSIDREKAKYGYKAVADWDGTIAVKMYHPGGLRDEPVGPDYPATLATVADSEEY